MKKFSIVGGGTAGWLTALFVKKRYPESDVTVIASSEIGILGAGEGTTPEFLQFLKNLDIPISEIVKHAKATIKNGIKFTNWNGDGEYYYHSFSDELIGLENVKRGKKFDFVPYYLNNISKSLNLDNIHLNPLISECKQVKISKITKKDYGTYALHFDASLLAKYLQSVALSRGIKLVDDEIIKINKNDNDEITSFNLKNDIVHETEYVFDCSGFRRLIIGENYKTEWISYKSHLPVNRAIPFFIQNDSKEITPYTESIAMKYGWMWKIPVQGRYGCGYVFDSSFVSDEDVKKELEEYLGHEIVSPRIFSFEPGVFDKICVKNCCAVGLSSGFVEPLEATSIWVSIIMLEQWGKKSDDIFMGDEKSIDYVNRLTKDINLNVLNFIQYHYITKREDSEFWKTFLVKNKKMQFIEDLDEMNNHIIPKEHDLNYISKLDSCRNGVNSGFNVLLWSESSWHQVGAGIRYFNPDVANKLLTKHYPNFDPDEFDMPSAFKINSEKLFGHYEYLEYLKNGDN
jgi:tryptophan halogenase